MNYTLGTGRFNVSPEWEFIWQQNNARAGIGYYEAIKIEVASRYECMNERNTIYLRNNLGHVGALLSGEKNHQLCGWSASVIALAMIAYSNESDFLYKEQDCLAFGPWVEQMYADMGSGDMVFGRKMTSAPWMQCSQSLFLIRHSFIPHFVWQYIGQGKDGDLNNLPEAKFQKIEEMNSPGRVRRLTFGCDRERPIPWNDKVFFAQKWTESELAEAKRRNLI